jgi:hypothetical protein
VSGGKLKSLERLEPEKPNEKGGNMAMDFWQEQFCLGRAHVMKDQAIESGKDRGASNVRARLKTRKVKRIRKMVMIQGNISGLSFGCDGIGMNQVEEKHMFLRFPLDVSPVSRE